MDLLLKPDVILKYFDELFQVTKDKQGQLIARIIDNDTNSFVLNRKIVDKYEKLLQEKFPNGLDNYFPFLNEIISKRIDVSVEMETEACFEDIEKHYLSDLNYARSVVYSNISIGIDNQNFNQYSCVLEKISFPNVSWIISELACLRNNSLTVRYFDFVCDDEIKLFFDNLFMIALRYRTVFIYDRHINFQHNLFDLIKNTHTVFYYTAYSRTDNDDNIQIRDNFRTVRIFKTRREQIHERKLIIKDLVIEVDNDFWNLRVDEHTWKIDVSLSFEIADKIAKKNITFKRCYH